MVNRPQKIMIHALGATMGGAMRHLTNFLPELGKIDSSREYVVLVRASFPVLEVTNNIHLERISDQSCSNWFGRVFNDIFILPYRLKKEKFSAIVSLTNFGPIWTSVPHIFFQRNALYYYQDYLDGLRGSKKVETLLRRRLAIESMKRAELIVTPSKTMIQMIIDSCPVTQDKHFKAIYHGLNSTDTVKSESIVLPDELSGAFPVLFFPSHLAEFKGYRILFDMVALLYHQFPKLKLVLTISIEDNPELIASYQERIQQLKIDKHVLMVGRTPQDEIWALYERSDVMVYPSLCESFGFSMLEAMGESLPIVAADTKINREICGNAAMYYESSSPEECAKQITSILMNPEQRDILLVAEKKRLKDRDWSWNRNASNFVSMIEELGL